MGNVYFPAGDGQHAHGKLGTGDLEIDDDIRPVVVTHKREHPECFPATEDWPVMFQHPTNSDQPPFKVDVFCGKCKTVIGKCTVLSFKVKKKPNGKRR